MSAAGEEARRFCRRQGHGVLSTISKRLEGYPFGSVSPFILDHAGRPVILISDIAEHTKNIAADPRVSLIVQPFSQDMQETARVTVLGEARRLADKDELGPRYLRYFPQAEAYFGMHDFNFYRIEPVRVRWIGGFGKVHWLEPESYLAASGELAAVEASIVAHMNADHADSLRSYCQHLHDVTTDTVTLLGVDPDGFDLKAGNRVLRCEFTTPVTDAMSARQAFVGLSQQCRA